MGRGRGLRLKPPKIKILATSLFSRYRPICFVHSSFKKRIFSR